MIIKKDDDKFSTIDKNDMLEVIGNHSHLNVIENKNQIHKDGTYLLINDEFNEYSLSLTCDNDIISVDGDNATFTAKLKHNGVVCEGKYITFHANEIEQSIKTDQNGIATFVYEPQGAGLVNVIASFMLLQETYEVLDCLYYDSGVTGTNNTDWFNRNNLSVSVLNDGTSLTGGASSGNYMPNIKDTPHQSIADVTEWEAPFVFEYDLVSFDNSSYHSTGVGTIGRSYAQLGLTGSHHIKMVYDGSTVKYYLDNSSSAIYTGNLSTTPTYCTINVGSGYTQKIKDVKIYPI